MYNEQRQLARDSDAIPLFSKTKQAFFWMCFTFFSNRRDAKKAEEVLSKIVVILGATALDCARAPDAIVLVRPRLRSAARIPSTLIFF